MDAAKVENKDTTIATLQQQLKDLQTEVREGRLKPAQDAISRQIEILEDPYETQRALSVNSFIPPDEEFPEGQILRWLNPRTREASGYKGFAVMGWDDKYAGKNGELLKNYVPDPPSRMSGGQHLDNTIRRGDMVLGRLDYTIWKNRQLKRELESMRRRGALETEDEIQKIRDGVVMMGKGLSTDEEPKLGIGRSGPDIPYLAGEGTGKHRTELMETEDKDE